LKKYDSPVPIEIDQDMAMDVEQLLNGGFHPLHTFMNFEDLDSVLKHMRLSTGEVWPIPILFPLPLQNKITIGMTLLLKFNGVNLALLKISRIFQYDKKNLIKYFYGTLNSKHPGVVRTKNSPNRFVTGKLRRIQKLRKIIRIKALDPSETKKIIKNNQWQKVVGFHTRNPPHRAHEFLQKCSLENSDGILIHPVIGSKKKGDFNNNAILES